MSPLINSMVGKHVIVRTVTNYFTGEIVDADDLFLQLRQPAWVADTGRWTQALTDGGAALSDVEPYPDPVLVGLGAIVDVTEWRHPLPTEVK